MNAFSNSQQLRYKIRLTLGELQSAAATLLTHPQIANLYTDYLFTLHTMMRASVPLMETSLERASAIADKDPAAAGFADYLSKHIREELHHDDWLLDDLEVLGADRASILKRIPSSTVSEMVGSQYYWIYHYHPIALLGYIAVMEGYPNTLEMIDDIRLKTGFPREAFRTLIKHANLDIHHRDDMNKMLDKLPLTPSDTAVITVSAIQTVHLAAQSLREVVEQLEPVGQV
ncbi:iron-containing redox enzyme family protein [Dictyobacter formicarum]|uniref:Iron-containing redox enzyme family protein n=1 Tax=Dictyobacter formicarum TaxID=2778368 RepID=A0ABQ3VUU1_9CHLR|nr:iron-containing redox enzyme family protein [Dictyobacter formicarum]GHO88861.1 hypothetical protein KSZ_68670 [Dictyobacter formicarum]